MPVRRPTDITVDGSVFDFGRYCSKRLHSGEMGPDGSCRARFAVQGSEWQSLRKVETRRQFWRQILKRIAQSYRLGYVNASASNTDRSGTEVKGSNHLDESAIKSNTGASIDDELAPLSVGLWNFSWFPSNRSCFLSRIDSLTYVFTWPMLILNHREDRS